MATPREPSRVRKAKPNGLALTAPSPSQKPHSVQQGERAQELSAQGDISTGPAEGTFLLGGDKRHCSWWTRALLYCEWEDADRVSPVMRVGDTLEVVTLFPVDRDEVGAVGEVWSVVPGGECVCEVTIRRDWKTVLEVYPRRDGECWVLDYEDFVTALVKARECATPPLILKIFQGADGHRTLSSTNPASKTITFDLAKIDAYTRKASLDDAGAAAFFAGTGVLEAGRRFWRPVSEDGLGRATSLRSVLASRLPIASPRKTPSMPRNGSA